MLVVGAGPAGAELTRLLALSGIDVVLIERLSDLSRAAFSSAALPLEALERFSLPGSVVAARWSGWQVLGPGEQRRFWDAETTQGVVLDFAALRHWLVSEAQRWGARVLLGHRLVASEQHDEGWRLRLQTASGKTRNLTSDWLIDATGQERGVLGDPPAPRRAGLGLVSGVGLEWLVAVSDNSWQRWAGRLAFALGSDWVSQGYGWVFPMQAPCLKIGVCRLLDASTQQEPLGRVMQRLLSRLLDPRERREMEVLDRHGGLIRSTIHRREPHQCGRLIGVGDAVSTANLLGGEGIRHALTSSRELAPLLLEALQLESRGRSSTASASCTSLQACLDAYPSRLRHALGWRWAISGRLARRTWLGLQDEQADHRLDRLLASLEGRPARELGDLLFGYRFERYGLRALPYLLGWR